MLKSETPARHVVVIGASSGGVHALQTIAEGLARDLRAAVLVVVHTHSSSPGYLPHILNRIGSLPARHATDAEVLVGGQLYVAPPDQHLLVDLKGTVILSRGPKENRARPAIDPLFRSAALAYGRNVIGVILTGYLDDGSAGLRAVKLCGGISIVQDPASADAPDMPRAAMRSTSVDFCLPLTAIARKINELVAAGIPAEGTVPVPRELEIEAAIARGDVDSLAGIKSIGEPSLFTCPACNGVLSQITNSQPLRFRCHTGHAYTYETLREAVFDGCEDVLWDAIRVLQERVLLMKHLADHVRSQGDQATSEQWEREALAAERAAEGVRKVQHAAHGTRSPSEHSKVG